MIILSSSTTSHIIFSGKEHSKITTWIIVDDIVMGGKSSGTFKLSPKGYGIFKGDVSLKNNGGFSSVKCMFEKVSVKEFTKIIVNIKGDGKEYQLRIKANSEDNHSYKSSFLSTNKRQEIEIYLKDMYPFFRGKQLDLPDFSNDYISQITFLIRNNKEENFKLLIDSIELK